MQIHDKLTPWRIAAARRTFVMLVTLPMIWTEAYMKAWHELYKG